MKNVTGQIASGDDFFDREAEQKRYWANLETDNLLLLAPRRVGKTSLMRRMQDTSQDHDYRVSFVDVSDARDELAFVQRLYQAVLGTEAGTGLWDRIKESWLGKVISRVHKVGGVGFIVEFKVGEAQNWSPLGHELAGALSNLEGRWLIQIDELPVFILKLLRDADAEQRTRVREFLYWMRRLRLEYSKVRWMLAGSIGLDTVTARLNLADTINDLRIETLGPYQTQTAHALLCALGQTYAIELPEPVRQRMIDRIGWPIPYYLQLVFHELHELHEWGPNATATIDDVDRVFEKLLEPAHRVYFDYWRQRLHDELGHPDSDHAIELLTAICRDDRGLTREGLTQILRQNIADMRERDAKLRYLLDVLQSDGYLVEHQQRWLFRFPLLRDYWRQRVSP